MNAIININTLLQSKNRMLCARIQRSVVEISYLASSFQRDKHSCVLFIASFIFISFCFTKYYQALCQREDMEERITTLERRYSFFLFFFLFAPSICSLNEAQDQKTRISCINYNAHSRRTICFTCWQAMCCKCIVTPLYSI